MKSAWNDKLGSRSREAVALLVTEDGEMHRFRGESIPDVCHVSVTAREKNGKWSSTTYEVVHRDSTSFVAWRQDFETGLSWPQSSFSEAFVWLSEKAPGVSFEGFKRHIEAHAPKTFERWQQREEAERAFAETRPLAHAEETEALRLSLEKKLKEGWEEDKEARSSADRLKAELRMLADRTDEVRKQALRIASEAKSLAKECTEKQEERNSFCSGAWGALDGLSLD